MSDSHFEILVNGIPRTWRDVEKTAVAAAQALFTRDKGGSEIVLIDHKAGRRWRVATDFGQPAWVALPTR